MRLKNSSLRRRLRHEEGAVAALLAPDLDVVVVAQLQEPGRLEGGGRDVAVRRHELSIQYLRLAYFLNPRLADEDAARVWSCFSRHRRRGDGEGWLLS